MIDDPQERCYEVSPVEGFPEWQHIYDANPHRVNEYLKRELFNGGLELRVSMGRLMDQGWKVFVHDHNGIIVADSWSKHGTIEGGIWKAELLARKWITEHV